MKSEIDASWISFSLIKTDKEQFLTFVIIKKDFLTVKKRTIDLKIFKEIYGRRFQAS
jgi:hypothetical protein